MKELEIRKKTNAGFTLIEIMLVVVIIGMLAAVAGVNINKQGNSAKIKTAKGQMKNFATAADLYQLENGQYPSSLQELVPDYMEDIPTDPWQQ